MLDYRRVRYLKKTRCKNYEINLLPDDEGPNVVGSLSEGGEGSENEESQVKGLSQSSQSENGGEQPSKKRGGKRAKPNNPEELINDDSKKKKVSDIE